VRPLLKKRTMDANVPGTHQPIPNLSFLSKVVEKIVDARRLKHINGLVTALYFRSTSRPTVHIGLPFYRDINLISSCSLSPNKLIG